jgi:hypothetical protein
VVPQLAFVHQVRAPIYSGAQGIVANDGSATLSIGPQGIGTRWYTSQVVVATSSGPSDQSECTLHLNAIQRTQVVGQTQQGGEDVLAFVHDMQPGDLLIARWQRANVGDLVSITVHGDQLALTSSPV